MPEPNKIPRAFADSGDKNSIPDSSGSPGSASWQEGFPAITSEPFAQGGIAPKRADFNGIFNALSLAILWQQQGGFYAYDNTTDYEVGNVVVYSNNLYKCLVANGPNSAVKAPTDTTVWSKVMTSADVAAAYLSLSGGTITGQTKIVTTNNGPGIFQIANSSITKGTAPSETVYTSLGFFGDDQSDYTKRLGVLETVYGADKSVEFILGAYKANTLTDTVQCAISCKTYPDGTVSTSAPTPDTADVSTKIATTAYVDAHASNVQAKTLSPTSAVTIPHYSTCAVQNHVCFVALSFELAATPASWTRIKIFDLPVTPTMYVAWLLNNQDGSVGGLYVEAETDGGLYIHFTGGSLPTNSFYHGGIVFPC